MWTEEDLNKLRYAYFNSGEDVCKFFPEKTRDNVCRKARQLGFTPGAGWLTLEQFALRCGTKPDTVSRWAKNGFIKHQMFGVRRYYHVSDLNKFTLREDLCPETGDLIIQVQEAARKLGYSAKTILSKSYLFNCFLHMGKNYIYYDVFKAMVSDIEKFGVIDWTTLNDRSKHPKVDQKRKAHLMRSFYCLTVSQFSKIVTHYKEDFAMDAAYIVQHNFPKEFWYSCRATGTFFHPTEEALKQKIEVVRQLSDSKMDYFHVFMVPDEQEDGEVFYKYVAEEIENQG